jgi:hypothetical protein
MIRKTDTRELPNQPPSKRRDMPHAFILRFPGGTLDQYDRVIEKMDLGGQSPPGAHHHWAAQTDDGLLVVDVWETPEVFQAFADEKIGPLSAEEGLSEPSVEHHEVHNTIPTPAS